jgi:glycerophosphoryl diester phosphodiesterase
MMTGCQRYQAGAPYGAIDVIAHRGASAYAPENTLAAFKLAKEMSADWFELDCTLTRDGEVVVMHDDTVDRTTNGTGYVRDLTLYDIKQLDAGSWFAPEFAGERVPTLGQALDFAKWNIGVYIEIKDSSDDRALLQEILMEAKGDKDASHQFKNHMIDMIEQAESYNLALTRKVIEEVRWRKMHRHVVIQSFSPIICAIVKHEAPEIRVEYLGGFKEGETEKWEQYLRLGYFFDFDGFNMNADALTIGRLEAFQDADKTVAIYTVNDLETMKRFVEWGVDGIITDKPDLGRTVTGTVNRAGGPPDQ